MHNKMLENRTTKWSKSAQNIAKNKKYVIIGANKEEEAAASLKKFYELAEIKPKFMCIICGLYDAVVKRPDGIYVLPITALKP